LIKTIRIDTDLISYLGDILIPKNLDYDAYQIKKKRLEKLKAKKSEEKQKKEQLFSGFGGKMKGIQIVNYR
jgi:hypothetical protein